MVRERERERERETETEIGTDTDRQIDKQMVEVTQIEIIKKA